MPKDTIISYYSGEKLRYRKDGQPDKRYKYGKRHAEISKVKTRITGRSLPKKPVKKEGLLTRFLNKLFGFLFILSLAGCVWQIIVTDYGGADASLYRTVNAQEQSVLEFNLESKKAYLENPVTIQETKDYMRYKFGDNYKVACMVAYGESLRTPNYVARNALETSAGIFHINLIDGSGRKVHWDKVPGETEDEKIAWLQVAKNAVDLTYKMSNGGTEWGQWMAHNNKSFLTYESLCD